MCFQEIRGNFGYENQFYQKILYSENFQGNIAELYFIQYCGSGYLVVFVFILFSSIHCVWRAYDLFYSDVNYQKMCVKVCRISKIYNLQTFSNMQVHSINHDRLKLHIFLNRIWIFWCNFGFCMKFLTRPLTKSLV